MIFRFLHPAMFIALAAVPVLVWAYLRAERAGRARIVFSDLSAFRDVPASTRVQLRHSAVVLRALAAGFIAAALARPQHGNQMKEIMSKGIDIMIVLDVSGSMKQDDLNPNRLAAAKKVVDKFITGREQGLQNDRIGMVVFSRVAFTKCPLTVDYAILKKIVARVDFTRQEHDGTAIGDALATGVARMEDSKTKSKVVILVTDGENNAGMDPMTAASVAQAMKVKVYTIGVFPTAFMKKVQDKIFGDMIIPVMPTVDDSQLRAIAAATGGKHFRVEDEDGLVNTFAEIDRLEKTEVKVKEFYRYTELYQPWIAGGLIFLLLELVLSRTVFRRLP